jgi:hypothetical protein
MLEVVVFVVLSTLLLASLIVIAINLKAYLATTMVLPTTISIHVSTRQDPTTLLH